MDMAINVNTKTESNTYNYNCGNHSIFNKKSCMLLRSDYQVKNTPYYTIERQAMILVEHMARNMFALLSLSIL